MKNILEILTKFKKEKFVQLFNNLKIIFEKETFLHGKIKE